MSDMDSLDANPDATVAEVRAAYEKLRKLIEQPEEETEMLLEGEE